MLMKMLERLQATINHPRSELTPKAVAVLNVFMNRLRTAIPILILAHRGLFYIYGRYYSIGRRLTGVDYVKVSLAIFNEIHQFKFFVGIFTTYYCFIIPFFSLF